MAKKSSPKTLKDLQKLVIAFRDTRNWKQFHNPKDIALSLVLEAGEVMEHFQWKNGKEIEKYIVENKQEIADELADVFSYMLIMANDLNIDIAKALQEKTEKNNKKYPVEKAKGNHTKYNKL